MKKNEVNKSRRSFFLKGSAALGAGLVSASAGAATLFDSPQTIQDQMDQLQQKLSVMEAREALKQLHLTFTALMENRAYDAIVDLFSKDATVELSGKELAGKAEVKKLFMDEYKGQKISSMHTAHRRDQFQKQDRITVNVDSKHASARFYNQVLICTPVRGQSVLAEMARQQGTTAQSYWENGCYDITFTRINGQWRISGLKYQKV